MFWLPKPLYELLPVIYAFAGMWGMLFSIPWYGQLSGAVMLYVFVWVVYKRMTNIHRMM